MPLPSSSDLMLQVEMLVSMLEPLLLLQTRPQTGKKGEGKRQNKTVTKTRTFEEILDRCN